jgi:hypothetical protein
VHRNSLTYKNYIISPVEDFSILAGFSCINPDDPDQDLNEFVRQDAEQHYLDKIAVTYILKDKRNPNIVLGFATLQNDAIIIDGKEQIPSIASYEYKTFPAIKIGRFGISIAYQRKNFGTLFLFMLKKLMLKANRTGCRFITVDARRIKKQKIDTRPFYRKNGFSDLPSRGKTSTYCPMYFDLKSIVDAHERGLLFTDSASEQ